MVALPGDLREIDCPNTGNFPFDARVITLKLLA